MKRFIKQAPHQTLTEELANAILHGIGTALSIIALVFMILYSNNALAMISSIIFGGSLVGLYLASTLYHSIAHSKIKPILRIIDHIMIYFLIAGTYTPFALIGLGGSWGWALFLANWSLALIGVIFKLFFTGRFEKLSIALYLSMGWMAVIAIEPILAIFPVGGIFWLLLGGIFYTFGVIFYSYDHRFHYSHTVWHLFVLMGSLCHVIAVLFYILKV